MAAGLKYKVFYSENLADWILTTPNVLSASDIPGSPDYEEVTVSIVPTLIPSEVSGFFRVKAEAAP